MMKSIFVLLVSSSLSPALADEPPTAHRPPVNTTDFGPEEMKRLEQEQVAAEIRDLQAQKDALAQQVEAAKTTDTLVNLADQEVAKEQQMLSKEMKVLLDAKKEAEAAHNTELLSVLETAIKEEEAKKVREQQLFQSLQDELHPEIKLEAERKQKEEEERKAAEERRLQAEEEKRVRQERMRQQAEAQRKADEEVNQKRASELQQQIDAKQGSLQEARRLQAEANRQVEVEMHRLQVLGDVAKQRAEDTRAIQDSIQSLADQKPGHKQDVPIVPVASLPPVPSLDAATANLRQTEHTLATEATTPASASALDSTMQLLRQAESVTNKLATEVKTQVETMSSSLEAFQRATQQMATNLQQAAPVAAPVAMPAPAAGARAVSFLQSGASVVGRESAGLRNRVLGFKTKIEGAVSGVVQQAGEALLRKIEEM